MKRLSTFFLAVLLLIVASVSWAVCPEGYKSNYKGDCLPADVTFREPGILYGTVEVLREQLQSDTAFTKSKCNSSLNDWASDQIVYEVEPVIIGRRNYEDVTGPVSYYWTLLPDICLLDVLIFVG